MMLFSPKWDERSQSVFGKSAVGVPYVRMISFKCSRMHSGVLEKPTQLSVSTVDEPPETSEGTEVEPLDQNQTLMKSFVRSIAYL